MNEKLKVAKGFQEEETVGVSPWMLSLLDELGEERRTPHWTYSFEDFSFEVVEGKQSLWIIARFPSGGEVALRGAFSPDDELRVDEIRQVDIGVEVFASSTIGSFRVQIEFPRPDLPFLHCQSSLTPSAPLRIPFWPRDVIPLGSADDLTDSEGVIYAKQIKARSGLVYFSLNKPRTGSVFYFQNLTSLNDYTKQTETSLAGVVGGEWPELGLLLPTSTEKALEAGKEIVLSDAYMICSRTIPEDDLAMSMQFLDFLAQVYLALPRIPTEYIHWPNVLKKSLRDLSNLEKCWSEHKGQRYLNAYVGDSETPPESMVQLTVLLPLLEYQEWSQEEVPITEDILPGLPGFFDPKAGVFGRWQVSETNKLDGSEPQKKPESMDSWYLYHSLLNISRLALHGDETARKLFLDSMDYAIKVGHRFEYHWPVFYDLYTLEVMKAEIKEGEGGEPDVACLYVHVMLQAWELTGEKQYLEEAKKAARTIKGLGFNLFYQANEVLFGAGALLRLWKETEDELYLNLSYLCIANTFNNVWLWDCNYGYGEYYPTFFALFPLKDAPYTAVYEELEGFAALHDYLANYNGDAPEWVKILIPEFIRNLLYKASFYYPPNLPKEMLTEEPKTGELDPKLWIPVEDMYEGWEKAGQVGQEVYGAGLPFGIVPRHYWHIPNEKFMIYTDYPVKDFYAGKEGMASLQILGDRRLSCRVRVIPTGRKSLPDFEVKVKHKHAEEIETLEARSTPEGHLEYDLTGDCIVMLEWKTESQSNKTKNGRKGSKK